MQRLLTLGACVLLSACVAVVPVPVSMNMPATAVVSGASEASQYQAADSFTDSINAFRRSQGVGPLKPNALLTRAAQSHANDMKARGYFAHRSPGGPNGATLLARAQSAGCVVRLAAENIAQGQRTPSEVLTGWANSPGHRSNMLNARMTDYGLGKAGDIWVLNLSSGC